MRSIKLINTISEKAELLEAIGDRSFDHHPVSHGISPTRAAEEYIE